MCGIIGLLSLNDVIDRRRFELARDSMTHRGPDAFGAAYLCDGRVGLGHRRLAIVDVSASANQPMNAGQLWVSFNGEIYNYRALRHELEHEGCVFRTNSDTEVLLHGYRVWGEGVCEKLSGMFAFALWDEGQQELVLVRDHVGQKPLYLARLGTELVFASEIKAIKSLAGRALRMRCESVIDHLIYDFVPEPYTWYEEVEVVPAGSVLVVSMQNGRFLTRAREYWSYMPPIEPAPVRTDEAITIVADEVTKAVESHLVADVEVGAFLSGGIDSSCVVSAASGLVGNLKTFSVGFDAGGHDELPLARETSRRYGTHHHELTLTKQDFDDASKRVLGIFDQPMADSSFVPTERVSSLAARDVKVVLSGDGGDEVFGGYDFGRYLSPWMDSGVAQRLRQWRHPKTIVRELYDLATFSLLGPERWQARGSFVDRRFSLAVGQRIAGERMRECLSNYDPYWAVKRHTVTELDPVRRAQWLYLKVVLPGKMLPKLDRCSMLHSLEARSPFLAPRLVEAMLNLPTAVRNPTNDWYKGLLREWLRGRISEDVLNGAKQGFGSPARWYPRYTRERVSEGLQRCIGTGLVRHGALSSIARRPKVVWKLHQVERAITSNLFVP